MSRRALAFGPWHSGSTLSGTPRERPWERIALFSGALTSDHPWRPTGLGAASKSPVSASWEVDNQRTFATEGWVKALSGHRADVAVVSDRDLPGVRDRKIESHDGARWPCRNRRRLHGGATRLAAHQNLERHRVWPLITDLDLDLVRPWGCRRFGQSTSRSQERYRDAQHNGPQHDAIFGARPSPVHLGHRVRSRPRRSSYARPYRPRPAQTSQIGPPRRAYRARLRGPRVSRCTAAVRP